MKKTSLQVAILLALLSCFGSANATETRTPLVPLPSIVDFTNGDGWGAGLGLGVEYETAYEGSDEFEFEVEPAGARRQTGWDGGFEFRGGGFAGSSSFPGRRLALLSGWLNFCR